MSPYTGHFRAGFPVEICRLYTLTTPTITLSVIKGYVSMECFSKGVWREAWVIYQFEINRFRGPIILIKVIGSVNDRMA
jgi:hypothetical protein